MNAKKLCEIMKANKLSQKAMSELFFVSSKTVARWMHGESECPKGMEAHFRRMGIDVPNPSWIDDLEG